MLNCWTASCEKTLPLVLMATMWENCTQPVAIHVNASASGHGRIGSVHPCCTGTFPRYTTYSYTRIGSDRGSPQSVRGSPQIHNISAEFMNKHCCKSAHLVENFLHDWTLVLPLTILVEGEWNQLLEFERFACHRACMMLVEVGHNIRYVNTVPSASQTGSSKGVNASAQQLNGSRSKPIARFSLKPAHSNGFHSAGLSAPT